MRNRSRSTSNTDDVTELLRAAAAPAAQHELTGLPAALQAFRAVGAAPATAPSPLARSAHAGRRIGRRAVMASLAAIGIAFAGGVSYAATSGHLDWFSSPPVETSVTPSAENSAIPSSWLTSIPHDGAATPITQPPSLVAAPVVPAITTSIAEPSSTMETPQPLINAAPADGGTSEADDSASVESNPVAAESVSTEPDTGSDGDTVAIATAVNISEPSSTSTSTSVSAATTPSQGPSPHALYGLCTAWLAQQNGGEERGNAAETPARAALAEAAGGPEEIAEFCETLVAPSAHSPTSPTELPSTDAPSQTAPGNSGGKGNSGNAGNGNSGNAGSGNSGNGNSGNANSGNSDNGVGPGGNRGNGQANR